MTRDRHIFIKNIYYMLSYAFSALRQEGETHMAAEAFENLHNLLAAILAQGIGRQLKQGLCREYRDLREDLTVVRGRIEMPGTMRSRLAGRRAVCCAYDALSENNLLNQILKTTALLLLRHGDVDARYKTELKKELLFFSRVDPLEPASIPWSAVRFPRGSGAYRMLVGLCRLVLEGMLLTTEDGKHRLASFLDAQRMSRLYEKFILEYYAREWPGLQASASQIPWALDGGDGAMLPVMRSDITLSRGRRVLIIDAKYYSRATQTYYDARSLHSAHLYQIFTYVKNQDAAMGSAPHTVSGLLLYAGTDEAVRPDQVYRMSGNRIGAKTLDLNREFSEIAAQLNAIAAAHFGPDCAGGKFQTRN